MQRLALWTIFAAGIGAMWVLGMHRVVALVWPEAIVEVVTIDGEGARWSLREAGTDPDDAGTVVTRPRNATVAEAGGERLTGYVLGIRDGQSWIERPELLRFAYLDPAALEPGWTLVMAVSRDGQRNLPADRLSRVYRPNRLDFRQNLELALDRLAARLARRLEVEAPPALAEAVPDEPAD